MIILLNGTSSSGKTSIAKALLNELKNPYFYFSVDQFLEPAMPLKINMDEAADLALIDHAISGFNHALREYAQAIEFMIIDHVLQKPIWLKEVATALSDSKVFFVSVTAPLEVIEKRENNRIDRQPGTAKAQYETVQSYTYDLVVDTSKVSPEEAAKKIFESIHTGSALQASANAV